MIQPRAGDIGGRYYCQSSTLLTRLTRLTRLQQGGTPFIVRLSDISCIEYHQGHPVTGNASGKIVIRDSQARLGVKGGLSVPLRLIQVRAVPPAGRSSSLSPT